VALVCAVPSALQATLIISEFLASNSGGLRDSEGQSSDWIELHNAGTATVDLAGWHLTDNASRPTKWTLPATNLAPGGFLVVFASEKDRRVAGAELHTNFKLSSDGEFLALTAPGGTPVISAFAPAYPPQTVNVSYGPYAGATQRVLVEQGSACRVRVPLNGADGLLWSATNYNDSAWAAGGIAAGFDRNLTVNFNPYIGMNVETAMYNKALGCYVRVPFVISNPAAFVSLELGMMYDDGYVAYLNGREIARRLAPATPVWNSAATGNRADATCLVYEYIALTNALLVAGTNVLALHGMNQTSNSSDFLVGPLLQGVEAAAFDTNDLRYFPVPTPGAANGPGVVLRGPLISESAHAPLMPGAADELLVTTRVTPVTHAVSAVECVYRVMFGSEVRLVMADDGLHGDGVAGDGVYGARIPAGAASPGEMVRYYFSAIDTQANTSRWPFFITPDAPEYFGTVVDDPVILTNLPVLHWFVQNTNAAETYTGTRCALFYNGAFYDNVFVAIRGATSALNNPGTNLFKNPHQFEFTRREFVYDPALEPVNDLIVHSMYNDGAYCRDYLSWESFWRAGVPASTSFYLHVRQNAHWHSIGLFIEQVDRTWLRRQGYPDQCALYKAVGSVWLDRLHVNLEKHYPEDTDYSDILALIHGLTNGTLADRWRYACDYLDVPQIANVFAAHRIIQDYDARHNNMYYYRDFTRHNLWSIFPWDKDQTFGHYFAGTQIYADNDWYDQGLSPGNSNRYGLGISSPFFGTTNKLYDLFFEVPELRQMFTRRLRTLMDELLQPPDTPPEQLRYEARIRALYPLLKLYADTDRARWSWPSKFYNYGAVYLEQGVHEVTNAYLAPRRVHLYATHSETNGRAIPLEQPPQPAILFGALEVSPVSGNQDEEFIELRNTNTFAVDISGWRLSNAVEHVFQPGTVIPAAFSLYVAPNVSAFRARSISPKGGEGRFVQGDYRGHLSAWGEEIVLLDQTGALIGSSNYPAAPTYAQLHLRVTEMMYHPSNPAPGGAYADEDYEFIELMNTGTNALDLQYVAFTDGIACTFPDSVVLPGGGMAVLVRHPGAFASLYDTNTMLIAGVYDGALNNAGERVTLDDEQNGTILSYVYSDTWYPATDGGGYALEIINVFGAPDLWNQKDAWRPGGQVYGTPGVLVPEPGVLLLLLAAAGTAARRRW